MRAAILILALLTTIPTAGAAAQPARDPRLAQKITYRVRLRPVAEITSELSKLTRVTLTAGKSNSDWRVREDCATVIAQDIPLASLMDSIARALKFRWVRTGVAPNYSYRLTEDPAALAAVERQSAEAKKKATEHRRRVLVQAQSAKAMSDRQLSDLKANEPWLYLASKTGTLQPLLDFFRQVPAAEEAFVAGKETTLSSAWFSASQREAAMRLARASVDAEIRLFDPQGEYPAEVAEIRSLLEQNRNRLVTTVEANGLNFQFGSSLGGTSLTLVGASEVSTMIGKVSARAIEENRSVLDVRKDMREAMDTVLAKTRAESRASEVGVSRSDSKEPESEHVPDPALEQPLNAAVAHSTLSWTIASLSDVSGFAIVTDDLRGRTGVRLEKGTRLQDALERLAAARQTHWNRSGQTIEMWSRNWYDKRAGRISKAWLASLRKRLEENGTYDIDDLAEIAQLTEEQRSANWRKIFAHAEQGNYHNAMECLRLYASLDAEQREALFSAGGVSFADMTLYQKTALMEMLESQDVKGLQSPDLTAVGARVRASIERRGTRYVYTFTASTTLGPIPGKLRLWTPKYVPPPPPKPASVKPVRASALSPSPPEH